MEIKKENKMQNSKVFVNHSIITNQWKHGVKVAGIIIFSVVGMVSVSVMSVVGLALASVLWFVTLGHINFVSILAEFLKDDNMENTWMVKNIRQYTR